MNTEVLTFILNTTNEYLTLFIKDAWWFVLSIILIATAHSTWLYWRQLRFKRGWGAMSLLELHIPREITKNPRAMDQVLRSLHSLRNSPSKINEKYWDGEITRWFSLEITSFGGEVHLYIRCPKKQRGLIEAAILSYYPDVELAEADDYIDRLPKDVDELHNEGFEMFGGEMLLTKPAAYPIKTYLDYEVPDEDIQLLDPISSFLEILGKIKPEEFTAIQINIAPGPHDWWKEFDRLLEEMREKKPSSISQDSDDVTSLVTKSPGQIKVLRAVEEKLSQPVFDTIIRFIYISPKATYYDNFARKGIVGAFNQYGTLDMNGFKPNFKASTRTRIWDWPYIFPHFRKLLRQKRIYHSFITRDTPEEEWVGKLLSSNIFNWNIHSKFIRLSSAEVATLFHPPTHVVLTAPHIPRVESRKAGPPAGLPIFSNDGALGKFE